MQLFPSAHSSCCGTLALMCDILALYAQTLLNWNYSPRNRPNRYEDSSATRACGYARRCLMDVQICTAYEGALRASLGKVAPYHSIVSREDVATS